MPNFSFPGVPDEGLFDRVVETATAAEAAGFDLVTVMDHFYQISGVGAETEPMLEAWSTLAALAARTTRIRLSTLVTGVTYRTPALLAKTATTLDVISKARHGDIGHWFFGRLEDLKRKKEIFERHCETEGRDPSTVLLTIGAGVVLVEHERDAKAALDRIPDERRATLFTATPAQAAERLNPYLDAGFGGFTLSNQTLPTPDAIALGGELIRLMSRTRSAA